MEIIKLEKSVFEKNGKYWMGDDIDCPWSSCNKVGKAGMEYPKDVVDAWGVFEKPKAKKEAPKTKAKKPVEDKSK